MSELDEIRARVHDCATYNFGMRNADKLAHEDAPRLLAIIEQVAALAEMMGEKPEHRTTAARIREALAYNDKDRGAA